ncbi:MAG: phosphoenolpyruvate--protein phosphotransferase [Nitrospinales bacterium]
MLKGFSVSPGVAIGKAHLLDRSKVCVLKHNIEPGNIDAEINRFRNAIEMSKTQMQDIKQRAGKISERYSIILDTYTLLLEDEVLVNDTIASIEKDHMNAEWALTMTMEKFSGLFNNINDEYIKGKQDDLDLVVHGIIKNLLGHTQENLAEIDEPSIIITHALSPSDTFMISREFTLGLAMEVGGKTSHVGIFASAHGFPAVVGIKDLTSTVNTGDTVIIDAIQGEIITNPTEDEIEHYQKKRFNYQRYENLLLEDIALTSETQDGHHILLTGNIESSHEIKSVKKFGGEGIGLFRTEFLYMNPEGLPTEKDLFDEFKTVIQAMDPDPVVIRTLDIGGDKQISGLENTDEDNPVLGLRGIRLSLIQPEILKSQLRAILRAGIYGTVKVLYPMVSYVDEILQVIKLMNEVKEELTANQIPFNDNIEIGAMIETPAAALCVDSILEVVDFISIGTNDLIQYILAVDRMNQNVAHLYQPFHPAILKTLKNLITSAKSAGKPLSICGELGGDPLATFLILGLGLEGELSMDPHSIPKVKKILRKANIQEAKDLADKVLEMSSTEEINSFINDEMRARFPSDFDRDKAFGEKSA